MVKKGTNVVELKYRQHISFSPQNLHRHCLQFLLEYLHAPGRKNFGAVKELYYRICAGRECQNDPFPKSCRLTFNRIRQASQPFASQRPHMFFLPYASKLSCSFKCKIPELSQTRIYIYMIKVNYLTINFRGTCVTLKSVFKRNATVS